MAGAVDVTEDWRWNDLVAHATLGTGRRGDVPERSLLGIAGNSTSRSATNLNLGSSPFRRAPVWSLTRGGCPCTAWKHVSGVRGATRG